VSDHTDVTKERAARQRQQFQEKHTYPANLIPDVWIGQNVALNTIGSGGKDNQLGPVRASGMLEAVRDDGFVLSNEERVVFIPRSAIIQMELYDPDRRSTRMKLE
jgi:hypothetical protein